jgi:phosphoglycolate phosphatase
MTETNRRSVLLVDLDGTLTDPVGGIVGRFRMALEAMGRSPPPAAELSRIIGPPLRRSFARVLGEMGDSEEALHIYRRRYSTEGLFEAVVYNGVNEALTDLRAAGTRLFLCTAKPAVFAKRILSHFDLGRYFDEVYGDELDGRYEDKGGLVARILFEQQLEADECCTWGDRKHDVIAASRHGIPTIGALWGYGGANDLWAAGAEASPLQVAAVFRALASTARTRPP